MRRSEAKPSPVAVDITGAGPPVLLIHAGIADRTMWEPQWERWADRFTLIRYDVRGFGESADPPANGWTFHDDALAAIKEAGHERAAVIGCSMGSEIAFDLAVEHPDAVTCLVCVSGGPTPAATDPDLAERFEEIDRAMNAEGVAAANELELQLWLDGDRGPGGSDPDVRAAIGAVNGALLERQRDMDFDTPEPEPPARERLGDVGPMLAVVGAHDHRSVLDRGRELEAAGAQLEIIEGAAHLPSLERPEDFDRAVLPFLAANVAG